ncbi:peptidylprolyl isomerase [Nocardioides iriomotensis]|uniref:Peptidyl-prolyl cis-trans isomerase n=1 Tax=Nocardioides iriomotensis TaxID=715784 RepID=A0A4Q5IWE3_9ACTN|nr:peptidylprolyl isomerase [Nocardioides iriomotensis]
MAGWPLSFTRWLSPTLFPWCCRSCPVSGQASNPRVHAPCGRLAAAWEDRAVTETYATLKTNHGDIVVHLFPNHAPKTVENFVGLAEGTQEYVDPESGERTTGRFYDGLGFHRIIPNFMIQGGCPLGTGTGGPGYTFKDEFHPELQFDRPYLLAMANAGPGTNGSQFFITTVPTDWLNNRHTIFGEVEDADSQRVVDAIGGAKTGPGDRPVEPVVIENVQVERR